MTTTAAAPAPLAERPALRVDWRVVLYVLVALQLLWRGWALSRSFFWQDDFLYVDRADGALTLDFLLQDYNGHLMPLQFLAVWVVTALAPLDWMLAGGLVLVLQALASLAVLRLVRTLVGDGVAAVVLLTVYLANPLTFTASLWWASALQAVPLQLCTALVLTAWVRRLRGGGWRQTAVVVGGTVLGLLCWEKALLLPPLLVAATLLVGPQLTGLPVRELLRRSRGWFAALAVVTAAYVVAYLRSVEPSDSRLPTADEVVELMRLGVGETFIPALLGGPWGGEPEGGLLVPTPPLPLLLLAWQVTGLLVVVTVALGRWPALRAWLLLAGYLAADVALFAVARIDFIGTILVRDPRYTADAVIVAVLAGAGVVCAVRARATSLLTPTRTLVAGLLAAAVVVNGSLVAGYRAVERLPVDAELFVAGARQAAALSGGVDLVDGPVPATVVGPVFLGEARVAVVVGALGDSLRFGRATNDLRMLDGFGTPREIDIRTATTSPPRDGTCPWRVGTGRTVLPLETDVGLGNWVVRIGYYAGAPTTGVLEVGDRQWDVELLDGVHHLWVEVRGEGVDRVTLGELTGGRRVCVSDVTVGAPWPAQDG